VIRVSLNLVIWRHMSEYTVGRRQMPIQGTPHLPMLVAISVDFWPYNTLKMATNIGKWGVPWMGICLLPTVYSDMCLQITRFSETLITLLTSIRLLPVYFCYHHFVYPPLFSIFATTTCSALYIFFCSCPHWFAPICFLFLLPPLCLPPSWTKIYKCTEVGYGGGHYIAIQIKFNVLLTGHWKDTKILSNSGILQST
jgi:hypothetical protein